MASNNQQFTIPPGLTGLLEEFVVKCIQENPDDIVAFAAEYFTTMDRFRKKKSADKKSADKKSADKKESKSKAASKSEKKKTTEDIDDEPLPEPPKPTGRRRRQAVSAETNDPNEDSENVKPVVHPKTPEQFQRLKKSVENILLFKSCDKEQLKQILDAMDEKKVKSGELIIKQGDEGDYFYVVDSGDYDVFIDKDGTDIKVHTFKDSGMFGELALMYNCPRNATIYAKTDDGILWALDRGTFRRIVVGAAARKRKMYEDFLQNVPMLKELDEYERMNLADALESRFFEEGECIIKEKDEADGMYFIEKGRVRVTVLDGKEEKEISILGKGAYIGELALVLNQPRSASVHAYEGETKCAFLARDAFERLLGSCMEVMKRNVGEYEEQRKRLGIK